MKKRILLVMILCDVFILTGCMGQKSAENITYITSIGIDYEGGNYKIYVQALNFSTIAKSEGSSSLQQAAPILIGEATGKNIQSAFSKLEQHAALPLYYGHVHSLVLSETMIKDKIKPVLEFIGKKSLFRYNWWIFGVKGDIKKILLSDSFFNYSSLYTALHRPEELNEANYNTAPVKINEFLSNYYQPVGTIFIPIIKSHKKYFSESNQQKNITTIDGEYVFSNQKYKGVIEKQVFQGLKWVSKDAKKFIVSAPNKQVTVNIKHPKYTIKVVKGSRPFYILKVKANAILVQNEEDLDIKNVKKIFEKKIRSDIKEAYAKGLELNADILNLTQKPYRYDLKKWDISTINTLREDSLKNIDVSIKIKQNEDYK